MRSMRKILRAALATQLIRTSTYVGKTGQAWFVGTPERAQSIAEFLCGPDTRLIGEGRVFRRRARKLALGRAAGGAISIICSSSSNADATDLRGLTVDVPLRIGLKKLLPEKSEELLAGVKNSSTKEDLRRVRKAGFTFRVTKEADTIRDFHRQHYSPLIEQRFPEDGKVLSLESMLESVIGDGELVCADIEGEWVAGLFNWAEPGNYAMGPLGIKDSDEEVRSKRVVSGLLVASMERGVELGRPTATMGFSLPFLGKGPIWFKAKWGCSLEVETRTQRVQILLDLRHKTTRDVIAASPIVHCEGDNLVASTWLASGEKALASLLREADRFPDIERWYVLGDCNTITQAMERLSANDRLLPRRVDTGSIAPVWLGAFSQMN